jgi:hypothetical protein
MASEIILLDIVSSLRKFNYRELEEIDYHVDSFWILLWLVEVWRDVFRTKYFADHQLAAIELQRFFIFV